MEPRGFEPLTFCMPCRRAPNCAMAPPRRVLSAPWSGLQPPCKERLRFVVICRLRILADRIVTSRKRRFSQVPFLRHHSMTTTAIIRYRCRCEVVGRFHGDILIHTAVLGTGPIRLMQGVFGCKDAADRHKPPRPLPVPPLVLDASLPRARRGCVPRRAGGR